MAQHGPGLEAAVSAALQKTLQAQPDAPLSFLINQLKAGLPAEAPAAPAPRSSAGKIQPESGLHHVPPSDDKAAFVANVSPVTNTALPTLSGMC